MISQFLSWYLIVQLITLATLPLATSLFRQLPDRGYAFTKSLGILLVALFLWLGTSYGLLRNEAGGAWVALILVAVLGMVVAIRTGGLGGIVGTSAENGANDSPSLWANLTRGRLPSLRYVLATEILFLAAFAAWAYVRAHDPAVDHTEQPMDLMFMNGIWHSPTYPPRDPWLAGYAISYYYFGYWMLTTLARLAGLTPAVAYNVGQACWLGLLLLGSFGIVYNLLTLATRTSAQVNEPNGEPETATQNGPFSAYVGGYLASIAVGLSGNLLAPLEWLYANGYNITWLTDLLKVYNFPENASVTNDALIGGGWWWWRSARVIEDLDLSGNHIEVIDEFPMFSYVLGDNHPHVLAMPFAILAVAMALNLLLQRNGSSHSRDSLLDRILTMMPLGPLGLFLAVVASGALIFLNTWDYPPYFLLLVLCGFTVLWRNRVPFGNPSSGQGKQPSTSHKIEDEEGSSNHLGVIETVGLSFGNAFLGTVMLAVILVVGAIVLYLPYFLTAQSQAGGFLPNLFYPTRFTQFLVMFGGLLPAVIVLLVLAWTEQPPDTDKLIASAILVYGLPVAWLAICVVGASSFGPGQVAIERVFLPPEYASHTAAMMARWLSQPYTFLLLGLLLTLAASLLWARLDVLHRSSRELEDQDDAIEALAQANSGQSQATFFALMLAAIGLLLAYVPEFIYLLDNFGTRMNTVFKFYYQAWLLLGLSGAYALVRIWGLFAIGTTMDAPKEIANLSAVQHSYGIVPKGVGIVSVLLILSGLIYPIAGANSKTSSFTREPTFDATRYVASFSPNEYTAIEWIRANTSPSALVLEAEGQSYRANFNRVSTMTGRPTLMGWGGHESQWRGKAFAEMANGRGEAITRVYQSTSPQEIAQTLTGWEIDYVYVGPAERETYGISMRNEEQLAVAMDLVFESGDVRVYARR